MCSRATPPAIPSTPLPDFLQASVQRDLSAAPAAGRSFLWMSAHADARHAILALCAREERSPLLAGSRLCLFPILSLYCVPVILHALLFVCHCSGHDSSHLWPCPYLLNSRREIVHKPRPLILRDPLPEHLNWIFSILWMLTNLKIEVLVLRQTHQKKGSAKKRHSHCFLMVGMVRFERTASASRTLHSNQTEPHPVARSLVKDLSCFDKPFLHIPAANVLPQEPKITQAAGIP